MDLAINEEEAAWVRELFYKVVNEGASGYALAEMLNNRGLRTRGSQIPSQQCTADYPA